MARCLDSRQTGYVDSMAPQGIPTVLEVEVSAARPRLPLPEQSESLAVPSNQRIRFDDCQGIAPFKISGKVRECKTNRIGSPSRFLVPLDVQHELFAEEQILGGQCRGRSECETEEDQS